MSKNSCAPGKAWVQCDVVNGGTQRWNHSELSVFQGPYNGGECQKWRLQHVGAGYYALLAAHSGKALDVDGCSTADGADVIQWPYWGGDCQRWYIQAP